MNVREELNKGINYFIANPSEMVTLYQHAKGVTISINCYKCIINAYNDLKRNTDERIYKMKKGKVIANPFGIDPTHWTNANVTDEVSEKLINLGYGKFFE